MKRKIETVFKYMIVLTLSFLCCISSSDSSFFEKNREKTYSPKNENGDYGVHIIPLESDGDCSIIHYQNTNIVIDLGDDDQEKANWLDVEKELNNYIRDGNKTIDYLVFTHGDNDHIGNFTNNCFNDWVKTNQIKINCFIDFDSSSDPTVTKGLIDYSMFPTYSEYKNARDELIVLQKLMGNNMVYFSASQCTYSKRGLAKKDMSFTYNVGYKDYAKGLLSDEFALGNEGADGKLKILYNELYDKEPSEKITKGTKSDSALKNCLSVCLMLEDSENRKYLFTGDLEEFDSSNSYKRVFYESKLVVNNKDDLRDGVFFYKAAHHGSKTSNSEALLDVIRPEIIAINGIASNNTGAYKFPRSESLQNFTKWTEKVYITKMKKEDTVEDMNGKISIEIDGNVKCSTNYSTSILDNEWISENRELHSYIYNIDNQDNYSSNCAYVKFGNIDILLNLGSVNINPKTNELIEKVKYLCRDKEIDYMIISSQQEYNYNEVKYIPNDIKIKNLIYHSQISSALEEGKSKWDEFIKMISSKTETMIPINSSYSTGNILGDNSKFFIDIKILDDGELNVQSSENSLGNNLPVLISMGTEKKTINYLNLGQNIDGNHFSKVLSSLKDGGFYHLVDVFQFPGNGGVYDSNDILIGGIRDFLSQIRMTDATLNILVNGRIADVVLDLFTKYESLELFKPESTLYNWFVNYYFNKSSGGQNDTLANGDIMVKCKLSIGTGSENQNSKRVLVYDENSKYKPSFNLINNSVDKIGDNFSYLGNLSREMTADNFAKILKGGK